MFDIGWTELLLIGLVALIVVGPKDLPGMFKALGQFTAKAKRMAREFTSAMEAAADDAGVNEVQKTLRDVANPNKMGMDALKKAADFDVKPKGPATTPALSPEREAAKQKILENSAKIANERLAKEAAEAALEAAPTSASKPAVKKTAAKKPAAKKSAATPAAAKKPAAKKPAAKKPAVKKAAAKPKTAGKTPKADT